MTKQEQEAKKAELRKLLQEADTEEKVTAVEEQLRALQNEQIEEEPKKEEEASEITAEQERSLIADTQELQKRSVEVMDLTKIGGKEKMEETRKFTTADAEYRSAWAKKMLGLPKEEFTEEEIRALGDAVGTTATEFVASTEDTQGINNYGLLIPDSVRMDWMKISEEQSPIFRDIRKMYVNGNIELPYLFASDDAEWYGELEVTKNEGQEFRSLTLTGFELAKDIEITWKAEAMTVDGFISFLLQELSKKMTMALINAVIYGDGNKKPTGITHGLVAETGSNAIDLMKKLLGKLSNENRIGAKIYVANDIADGIAFYKDENGNYPYLVAGLGRANGTTIEADPYLHNGDMLAGNGSNYILNFNKQLGVNKEIKVKPRRVVYGGYLIADGNKKPNSFTYGKVVESV